MIELSKEKPYEDACKILGLRPVANYKSYKLTDETRNFIKLETVAKALNEGWKPTTIDPKEVRYYVWGWNYTDDRKPSGLLTVGSYYVLSLAHAHVGISLEFKDKDTAKEFARICKPIIVKHLFGRDDHENFKFNF
ncbi:hypothetical protein KNV50_gp03 [uncultured phage cr109_1]|uniref:Uncharacterized protein n=1 Tax=uncultured phage cr109_1 TaxID=2772083 RepID=A0A7M1RRS8_9CAUD|nr:hypothetical protein KNV50_gp03 [uncultured phage cr109_1]QOR56986.1 hypothetical protein [uncultured phage cr109_1]